MPASDVEPQPLDFESEVPSPLLLRPGASWLVLALITLLYVGVSFTPVIFDDNEGLYAGAVREMHARHDWLVPMSNGFPRVQEPPLVYWTMLVSASVLGENEVALRLPNTLATTGWIVATFLIMRRIGGERFGLASAAALASMLGVWVFTHFVQPEPFLACFVTLALGCLVEARFEPRPRARWYVLFWVFLALATMSKGLHGALWPLGVTALLAMFFPSWQAWLRRLFDWRGLLFFTAITVPWYAYMTWKFPHFLAAHFLNEQMGAALDTRWPTDAKQVPLVQFYAQHLLFWMPWTLLAPGAFWAWRRAAPSRNPREWTMPEVDSVRLLACWISRGGVVSVAFSARQDCYGMSCWGVAAAFFVFPWTARQMGGVTVPRWFLVAPGLLVVLAGVGALVFGLYLEHATMTASALAAPNAQRDTFMDVLSGISPMLARELLPLFFLFGTALIVGGLATACLAWLRREFIAIIVLAATMAVPIVLAAQGSSILSPYFSLADTARLINGELSAQPDGLGGM